MAVEPRLSAGPSAASAVQATALQTAGAGTVSTAWDNVNVAASSKRTLVLLRHAKSAWPDVADHERPLAPRGRRDAPVVGRWLRQTACIPDQVLCSTARRARQTWQLAATALRESPPVTFERRIYGASAADLLDLIHHAPTSACSMIVVGHDPSVQELALALATAGPDRDSAPGDSVYSSASLERMRTKFPTGAIAVLEFSGPWSQLDRGHARLASFVTPRELGGHRHPT